MVKIVFKAALFALALSNALQAFSILLQIGAGTGLIYILRWFWWRINAYSEVTAMVVSFFVAIFFEMVDTGLLDYQKLIAGIVLTGGGSQLKHLKQLVEYITGMDTRIGYPNEHLAGDSDEDVTSPLYATAVGLVLDGLKRLDRKKIEQQEEIAQEDETENEEVKEQPVKERRSFLDKLTERVKDFLDNAE